MITQFSIENYKSINKLSIDLGRINVFIGENGCGKSNILEAFTLASAASQNKLDNEFLTTRGVRVTNPELMRSAFDIKNVSESMKFSVQINQEDQFEYELTNDNKPYSKWESKKKIVSEKQAEEFAKKYIDNFQSEFYPGNDLLKTLVSFLKNLNNENLGTNDFIYTFLKESYFKYRTEAFKNFLIYSPENTSLRTFEKEGQIEPLGIYGEGLFKLLKYFASDTNLEKFKEIKHYLKLFGWFDDLVIPEKFFEGESYLKIKDRFLDGQLEYFDQRSSNEGFLFVLFYFSLLISDKTPDFFAIDNIESSLNPKLCTKLIKCIAELSVKYKKQILITTHSPSILDGLDLNDTEQRLFLVYRNKLGYTVINPIEKPKRIEGQEPIKLSEAFLRGYLGGLPKNFSL